MDVRVERAPRVVADGRDLPFRDDSFQWVLADPPYSQEYAANLYGTAEHYPSPHALVAECLRVLRPGGHLGFLAYHYPSYRRLDWKLVGLFAVVTGFSRRTRMFSVFQKPTT